MPYLVTRLSDMYRTEITERPDLSLEEILEVYLNEMEAHGWQLHSTVPDHQMWAEDGSFDGNSGAKLVFYSETAKREDALADPKVVFESGD